VASERSIATRYQVPILDGPARSWLHRGVTTSSVHGRYRVESVEFPSGGTTLRGNLYVPADLDEASGAVPILGPYCYVKEQAPVQYATRLADEGFVALAFDARHHGASEGEPRRYEDPHTKVADLRAALDFLTTRPEVDPSQLAAVGVCEGSSEVLRAAVDDDRLTAVATISGHYRDHGNDIALMGGMALMNGDVETAEIADRLEARRARGQAARARFEATGEVEYLPIIDPVRTDVALPWKPIWDWYHGWADRGIWENRYAVMSDEPYLDFESLSAAEELTTPLLMVHADNSDGPDSARRHFAAVRGTDKHLAWQGSNDHFQYYEDPAVIDTAVGLAAAWFRDHR